LADEVELKYAAQDLAMLEAWLVGHLPFDPRDGGWRERTLVDRYFDTADRALERAGVGARLRGEGGDWTLTVKSDIAQDGPLHQRRELEGGATAALHPATWPASDAREVVERFAVNQPLIEKFALRQNRRVREVAFEGAVVEVSLDDIRVHAADLLVGRLLELEVEAREASLSSMRALAQLIEGSALVVPEPRNKMDIASQLVARER
jgi:triphosphatase